MRDMTRLSAKLCYMAGLYSKSNRKHKSLVCVNTGIEELRDRFVEIAVNELDVEPNKIMLDKEEVSAGFYHSRISKQLANIVARETYVFKTVNEFSKNYLAGIFDISGHIKDGTLQIRHITPRDAMMLENLGIHTKGDNILNVGAFIGLIKGISIVEDRI